MNGFTQKSLSVIGLVSLVIGFSPVVNADDTTTAAPTPTAAADPDPLAPGSHVGSFKSVRMYANITTTGGGWFSSDDTFAPIMGVVEDNDNDTTFRAATGYDGAHCTPISLSVSSINLAENANDPVVITLFGGTTPNTLSALPITGTVSAGPNVAQNGNSSDSSDSDSNTGTNNISNGQNFGCTIPVGSDSCTFTATANPSSTTNSASSTAMNFLAFHIENAPNNDTRVYTTLGSQCDIKYTIP